MTSAHALALALAGLALVLALTDTAQSFVPDAGVLRAALAAYLVLNALAVEFYIAMRVYIMLRAWHITALVAAYQMNEALFRSLALVNASIAVLAPFAGAPDRTWVLWLAVIGVLQFFLVGYFPVRERQGEWTEADIIRFYAQDSPRYLLRLKLMQYVYAAANFASLIAAFCLAVSVFTLVGTLAYDAFLSAGPPTIASLVASANDGLGDMAKFAQRLPSYIAVFASLWVVIVLSGALFDWSRKPRPVRPHLK